MLLLFRERLISLEEEVRKLKGEEANPPENATANNKQKRKR